MRTIDWNLAIALKKHWQEKEAANAKLCPLLADLDRLLICLDENNFRPGDALSICPECGQEHRWALLKELMHHALEMRPASQSKLLEMVEMNLEDVHELYGGKEGYRAMRKAAAEYFAKVGAVTATRFNQQSPDKSTRSE